MKVEAKGGGIDKSLLLGILFLLTFSTIALKSIAPSLFPSYFLYFVIGAVVFILFASIDFEVISLFSPHLYVFSIVLLVINLIIGQVTRGAVRWIPLGPISIQPAEIVRPFLILFFANYLTKESLNLKRLMTALLLLLVPVLLITIQPSLGVAILTLVSFFGVLLSSGVNKKYIIAGIGIILVALPIIWQVMAPYQRGRVDSFLNPEIDPLGAGYNSIQSMISVGSGKLTGVGLGKGVQTQLAFLPEKHTDFIFASVSEELGFVGASLLILGVFFILWRLTSFMKNPINPAGRAYLAGAFLVLFVQTIVNIGMNLGLLPITGLPLPLVSAGGSSLIATMIMLGIAGRATSKNTSNIL